MAPLQRSPRRPRFSIVVINRQSTCSINVTLVRQMSHYLLDNLPPMRGQTGRSKSFSDGGRLGVQLISAVEMAGLNEGFLGHHGSTDVLTFDYQETPKSGEICGEIFISVDDAVGCAPRFHTTWQLELMRYLAHGLLHLQGLDDHTPPARREMKKWENRLLKELSRSFDCAKLGRLKNAARRK